MCQNSLAQMKQNWQRGAQLNKYNTSMVRHNVIYKIIQPSCIANWSSPVHGQSAEPSDPLCATLDYGAVNTNNGLTVRFISLNITLINEARHSFISDLNASDASFASFGFARLTLSDFLESFKLNLCQTLYCKNNRIELQWWHKNKDFNFYLLCISIHRL